MAITRRLPCLLNDVDILDRAEQLANAERNYRQVDDERAGIAKNFRKQLEAIDSRISLLSNAIHDRSEERDVECRIEDNFDKFTRDLVRVDTGEVVESYDMTPAERNRELFPSR